MNNRYIKSLLPGIFFLLLFVSCENEKEIQPVIDFKTGAGYTFQDGVISPGSSITVGITAAKSENNFRSYNVSVSFDGASSTVTVKNFTMTSEENQNYDKDVTFSVRNQPGLEKYYFTIVDTDGNLIQKALTFTVK